MSTTAKTRTGKASPSDTTESDAKAGHGGFELVNPGTSSMAYDDQGHVLGGGERVAVDEVDEVARRAVQRGFLLCQDSEREWIGFDPVADPSVGAGGSDGAVATTATTETGPSDGGASRPE